jgi:myosin heavy subunit
MIIAAKEMSQVSDKEAAAICLERVGLEEEQFRLGHTKVFFRAGVLGFLEEKRDERIQVLVSLLQGQCRTYLGQKQYKVLRDQR